MDTRQMYAEIDKHFFTNSDLGNSYCYNLKKRRKEPAWVLGLYKNSDLKSWVCGEALDISVFGLEQVENLLGELKQVLNKEVK